MLALCLMLFSNYYAQNYAGIIGSGLIKVMLAIVTLLVHPKPDAPVNVITDASDVAIGAVLVNYKILYNFYS